MAPTPAALTIYAFGATCFAAGAVLLRTSLTAAPDSPRLRSAEDGNALAAIAMGLYYTISAYQENHAFFVATVPMRALTTLVFWRNGRMDVAIWEGVGALFTTLALLAGNQIGHEEKRGKKE